MRASKTLPDMASDTLIEGFISSQVTGRGLDVRTEKAYRMDLQLFYEWMAGQERGEAQDHQEPDVNKMDGSVRKEKANASPGSSCYQEDPDTWKGKIKAYLYYLDKEKKLRASTISRKSKVFQYYASYLKEQGILSEGWDEIPGKTQEPFHSEDYIEAADTRKISGAVDSPDTIDTTDIQKVYCITAGTGQSSMAKKPVTVHMTLSRQEVDALFQAMDHEYETLDSDFRKRVCLRDQVMLKLLFYHGIEISELLALEITDYDKEQGILRIRGKRGKQKDIHIFSATLRHRLALWLNEREHFQREESFSNRMFLSKLGKPLSMKMVILIFDKYRVMAGIEKECTPKYLKTSMARYGQEMVMEGCE